MDHLARLRVLFCLRAVNMAYCTDDAVRESLAGELGLKIVGITGQNHVIIAQGIESIVIAIKGTVDVHDWLHNLDALAVPINPPSGGRVHQGFMAVARQDFDFIEKALATITSAGATGRPIYVVGHSLGGAVATLVSQHLHELGYPVQLYTFGSPRVANTTFVRYFHGLGIPSTRVVCDQDIVPHVPGWPYRHVVGLLHLSDSGQELGPIRRFGRLLGAWVRYLVNGVFARDGLRDHQVSSYLTAVSGFCQDVYGPGLDVVAANTRTPQ